MPSFVNGHPCRRRFFYKLQHDAQRVLQKKDRFLRFPIG